uniref:Uncharacterized protein n=1 Tax=Strongyloides venezuelensis TaxID=75913 RepID=A0A0K0FCN5_STRVS
MTLFDDFKIDVSKCKQFNFSDVDLLIEETYNYIKWIDKSKNQFQVDFSGKLQNKLNIYYKIKLVVSVRKVHSDESTIKITFNGSFKIRSVTKYTYYRRNMETNIFNSKTNGVTIQDFLDTCFNVITMWNESTDIEINEESFVLEENEINFNPEEPSRTVKSVDENKL